VRKTLAVCLLSLIAAMAPARNPRGGPPPPPISGGGATLVFNYPSGFAGSSAHIRAAWEAVLSGSILELTTGAHTAGEVWYTTQQNVTAFTTDFTVQLNLNGVTPRQTTAGFAFVVQNTNATTDPGAFGTNAAGDANMAGYSAYSNQTPELNSVAVVFDLSAANNQMINYASVPSAAMLAINGGAYGAFTPTNDISNSLSLFSGNILAGNIVYDGTILTLTLKDTVTNAYYRTRWPVNIVSPMGGGNLGWIGFTGGATGNGSGNAIQQTLLTWDWYSGYNTRLAAPTFSVTPGQYASTQSVSLSGPAGASIYYTTNGKEPTNLSTLYSGPISVSASTIIKAIAVQATFTDSYTAIGNYQIQASGPLINLASGFGSSGLVTYNGSAILSGSALQLVNAAAQAGSAWYSAAVPDGTFTTAFTLNLGGSTSGGGNFANGMTFCLQNPPPTPAYSLALSTISGGINAVGNYADGFGYSGTTNGTNGQISGILSSVCVSFDVENNKVGQVSNGAIVYNVGSTPTGITLSSGHNLAVTLTYNGTTLALSMTDQTTSVNYSTSWTVNIPSTAGNPAIVGFTGGNNPAATALQKVLSWTYATP
jgi:hypothetical protein